MGCHGGFSLDEATRRSWYNPEAILLNLHTGMTFADIGCGDGFFTILAAKKVGDNGRVFAVDIDPLAIEKLKAKAEAEELNNITVKVGKAEDTIFCRGCVDFLLYSMDLHDFSNPIKVLQNARLMLKRNGKIIDLDWKKIEMSFGPPVTVRFSEEHVTDLLGVVGLSVLDIKDAGPYHYTVIAGIP